MGRGPRDAHEAVGARAGAARLLGAPEAGHRAHALGRLLRAAQLGRDRRALHHLLITLNVTLVRPHSVHVLIQCTVMCSTVVHSVDSQGSELLKQQRETTRAEEVNKLAERLDKA